MSFDEEDVREEDWVVEPFTFGGVTVQLKHISGNDSWSYPWMSRHVWPGAQLLCEDMAKRKHMYTMHRSVLILGAGTGLEGLVNAGLCDGGVDQAECRQVCLTDGASMSVELMQDNIALNEKALPGTRLCAAQLRFGERHDHEKNLPFQSPWDLVAISDSTFDYDLVPSVVKSLEWLHPGTLVVCSVTGGAPAFERLTDSLPSIGLVLVDPPSLPSDPTSRAARRVVLRFERVAPTSKRAVHQEDRDGCPVASHPQEHRQQRAAAASGFAAAPQTKKTEPESRPPQRTAWTWSSSHEGQGGDDETQLQPARAGGTSVHGRGPHTADGLLQKLYLTRDGGGSSRSESGSAKWPRSIDGDAKRLTRGATHERPAPANE